MNNLSSLIKHFCILTAMTMVLVADASPKELFEIYPLNCVTAVTNRSHSTRYCLNAVGQTSFEVLTVEKRTNSVVESSEAYLVIHSYDRSRNPEAGTEVAKRTKILNKVKTKTEDNMLKLSSASFAAPQGEGTLKEIQLTETDEQAESVRLGNTGLSLSVVKLAADGSTQMTKVGELDAMPVRRGLDE